MKMKSTKVFLSLAMIAVLGFTACKDDNNDGPETPETGGVLPNNSVLEGDIESDITLAKGNTYVLKGGVQVQPGFTITIEEGVTVKSDPNNTTASYLLIEPGAKIMAEGTAASPIVFTSGKASPSYQDWGGIVICGKAPVNTQGGTNASEMGQNVQYGGTDANDNSGVLRYIRVEFTGQKASATKEHNGFTFEGVGAGTQVDHLAVFKGGDDAFEWFGGTVNAKYLFAWDAQDDMFDWTHGWTGNAQFIVGVQGAQQGAVADRGIEADNNSAGHGLTPFSNPKISNVTLIGSKTAFTNDDPTQAGPNDAGKTIGLKLRAGTRATLYNFVVYNFSNGVDIQDNQTLTNVTDGSIILKNFNIHNAKPWAFKPTEGSPAFGANPFIEAAHANVVDNTGAAPAYLNNVFKGVDATNGFDPTTLGSFFSAAKYRGAVDPTSDWTAGSWVRTQ